ncbi:leucine-rich repeat domain-containing protein [Helicobacter burdigaliensis]|uniref:leucine-rich repeat domain-containing protein n=1 Tax=Helicobacter burdigaliensis TaxID=2315334 RepID=UPI000EF70D41|nr:leucine-rich repeat domain-containing protein [Helicobacter burdigaliensis]
MELTKEKVKSLGLDTEEVVIPKDIKVIEKDTFKYNTKIRKVILNEGLEVIEKHAFRKCESLEEISLPDSLKSIGEYAFYDCSRLKKLKLNEGLEVIEVCAFWSCKSLEEIILPNSLKSIGELAFSECSSLKSLKLNEGLESIGSRAFLGCESLEEISLPDSLKEIWASAFFRVYNLKRIHISKNHKYFGYENNVLYNKESKFVIAVANIQESMSFPECIKRIGYEVFKECSSLKSLNFNEGLEAIGENAFYKCKSLKEINFPTSLKTIERTAFDKCSSLKKLNFNEGLEVIEKHAFRNCESLEEISLPDSLKEIGEGAFLRAYKLKHIHISKNHEYFGYENNILYSKKKRKAVIAITNASEGITFPEYITAIPEDIFKNSNLPKVAFENKNYRISEKDCYSKGVNESIRTHLKGYMFNKAKKEKVAEIMSVSFESILQEIAKNYGVECNIETKKCDQEKIVCILQFQQRTKFLATIKIKNPTFKEEFESFVKLIVDKESTFESLQDFTKKNKDIRHSRAFALNHCIPYVKFSKLEKAFLSSNLKDLRVQIPQDVESIPEEALRDIKSLVYVKISEGVVRIEKDAFAFCSRLKEVELPSTLAYIGNSAFSCCYDLEQINIPNSVTHIGEEAFYCCNSLKNVVLPNSVTHIGKAAFEFCRSLKSVVLPNKLKEIEDGVFKCAGLESITIPASVETLKKADSCFEECPLKAIYGTKDSVAKKVAKELDKPYVEIQE